MGPRVERATLSDYHNEEETIFRYFGDFSLLSLLFYPFLFNFVPSGTPIALYVLPHSNQYLTVPCDPCFSDVTINPVFMEGKEASSFLGGCVELQLGGGR